MLTRSTQILWLQASTNLRSLRIRSGGTTVHSLGRLVVAIQWHLFLLTGAHRLGTRYQGISRVDAPMESSGCTVVSKPDRAGNLVGVQCGASVYIRTRGGWIGINLGLWVRDPVGYIPVCGTRSLTGPSSRLTRTRCGSGS